MIEKPKLVYDAPKRQYLYEWPDHHVLEPVFDLTKEYVEQLEAETDRLREELEVVGIAVYSYGRGDLKAENEKLRELFVSTISNYADGYMDGTNAKYPCDLCDESSMQQCDYQHDGQCPFYRRLRELGVEVPE